MQAGTDKSRGAEDGRAVKREQRSRRRKVRPCEYFMMQDSVLKNNKVTVTIIMKVIVLTRMTVTMKARLQQVQ